MTTFIHIFIYAIVLIIVIACSDRRSIVVASESLKAIDCIHQWHVICDYSPTQLVEYLSSDDLTRILASSSVSESSTEDSVEITPTSSSSFDPTSNVWNIFTEEFIDGATFLTISREEVARTFSQHSDAIWSLRQFIVSNLDANGTSSNQNIVPVLDDCPRLLTDINSNLLPFLEELRHERVTMWKERLQDQTTTLLHQPSLSFLNELPIPSSLRRVITPMLSQSPLFIAFLEPEESVIKLVHYLLPHSIIVSFSNSDPTDNPSDRLNKLQQKRMTRSAANNHRHHGHLHYTLEGFESSEPDVFHIHFPPASAMCLLSHLQFLPDLLYFSAPAFPFEIPSSTLTGCDCKSWLPAQYSRYLPGYSLHTSISSGQLRVEELKSSGQTQPKMVIFGTVAKSYQLDDLALLMDRRIYIDYPYFHVVTEHSGTLACHDNLGVSLLNTTNRQLVKLYMIVKDEAGSIRSTMDSVLPYVDRVVIIDTGSTDGTQQIIEDALEFHKTPGHIYTEPFIDFSTTRNTALKIASREHPLSNFIFMLNGDDTLLNGANFRTYFEKHRHLCGPTEEMFLMHINYGSHKRAWSERVFRATNHEKDPFPSSLGWQYKGVTHEVYTNTPYVEDPFGTYAMHFVGYKSELANVKSTEFSGNFDDLQFSIYHSYARDPEDKLRARALRDAELLLKQHEDDPDDQRTLYYLAHSYDLLADYPNAYHWHSKRVEQLVKTGNRYGDREECTSLLRLGKIAIFRIPEQFSLHTGIKHLRDAIKYCPVQIESRVYLAQVYFALYDQDKSETNYLRKAKHQIQAAQALVDNGKGLDYILEGDAIRQTLPKLFSEIMKAG